MSTPDDEAHGGRARVGTLRAMPRARTSGQIMLEDRVGEKTNSELREKVPGPGSRPTQSPWAAATGSHPRAWQAVQQLAPGQWARRGSRQGGAYAVGRGGYRLLRTMASEGVAPAPLAPHSVDVRKPITSPRTPKCFSKSGEHEEMASFTTVTGQHTALTSVGGFSQRRGRGMGGRGPEGEAEDCLGGRNRN